MESNADAPVAETTEIRIKVKAWSRRVEGDKIVTTRYFDAGKTTIIDFMDPEEWNA